MDRDDAVQSGDRVIRLTMQTRAINVEGTLRGWFALEQVVGDARHLQDFMQRLEEFGFRVELVAEGPAVLRDST
jgi:hypothetical protein